MFLYYLSIKLHPLATAAALSHVSIFIKAFLKYRLYGFYILRIRGAQRYIHLLRAVIKGLNLRDNGCPADEILGLSCWAWRMRIFLMWKLRRGGALLFRVITAQSLFDFVLSHLELLIAVLNLLFNFYIDGIWDPRLTLDCNLNKISFNWRLYCQLHFRLSHLCFNY